MVQITYRTKIVFTVVLLLFLLPFFIMVFNSSYSNIYNSSIGTDSLGPFAYVSDIKDNTEVDLKLYGYPGFSNNSGGSYTNWVLFINSEYNGPGLDTIKIDLQISVSANYSDILGDGGTYFDPLPLPDAEGSHYLDSGDLHLRRSRSNLKIAVENMYQRSSLKTIQNVTDIALVSIEERVLDTNTFSHAAELPIKLWNEIISTYFYPDCGSKSNCFAIRTLRVHVSYVFSKLSILGEWPEIENGLITLGDRGQDFNDHGDMDAFRLVPYNSTS